MLIPVQQDYQIPQSPPHLYFVLVKARAWTADKERIIFLVQREVPHMHAEYLSSHQHVSCRGVLDVHPLTVS